MNWMVILELRGFNRNWKIFLEIRPNRFSLFEIIVSPFSPKRLDLKYFSILIWRKNCVSVGHHKLDFIHCHFKIGNVHSNHSESPISEIFPHFDDVRKLFENCLNFVRCHLHHKLPTENSAFAAKLYLCKFFVVGLVQTLNYKLLTYWMYCSLNIAGMCDHVVKLHNVALTYIIVIGFEYCVCHCASSQFTHSQFGEWNSEIRIMRCYLDRH